MIYLDYNATAPLHPKALEAMMPYLTDLWGNPSSSYRFGSQLKGAVEKARQQVATFLNCSAREIIFTGSATESNNTAIHSAVSSQPEKKHIVTSLVEHSSVLAYCKMLESTGYAVTYVGVDSDGMISVEEVEASINSATALVTLMWANNETGVIWPVAKLAELCRAKGVPFHSDGVQAAGRIRVDLHQVHLDSFSISAHKLGGPKGIGVLFKRRRSQFCPLILGGSQEHGRRGGTQSVALIVGMGAAAQLAANTTSIYDGKIRNLRDSFENKLRAAIASSSINGSYSPRIANTSSINFTDIEAEAIVMLMDRENICVSTGSACLSEMSAPSHVIAAMKHDEEVKRNTIRVSFGLETTDTEVGHVLSALKKAVGLLAS